MSAHLIACLSTHLGARLNRCQTRRADRPASAPRFTSRVLRPAAFHACGHGGKHAGFSPSPGHTMRCMSDLPFLHIEQGAHSGAFGNNALPEPSEAQRIAGNYRVGRVSLYGLAIAIEQPRGSYRTGLDPVTGQRWACRMAAHYGYINGTKGNDGDCVDAFVGFYPQGGTVWVINQNIGGKFDEHKVMLAFPDEASARRAYQDSYERGWKGLESIVPCSVAQLKGWLKNGDMRRALIAADLPRQEPETLKDPEKPEGHKPMSRKIHWNSDALPCEGTLDHVLYDLRRADAGEGLLLDAVSAQEILDDAEGVLALDALVSPYARLERRMELLRGVMERASGKVRPVAMQITAPFKQRGAANVAVIFELSDGQTVSIYFHSPDAHPNRMAPHRRGDFVEMAAQQEGHHHRGGARARR